MCCYVSQWKVHARFLLGLNGYNGILLPSCRWYDSWDLMWFWCMICLIATGLICILLVSCPFNFVDFASMRSIWFILGLGTSSLL
jgi:hypothetical protein